MFSKNYFIIQFTNFMFSNKEAIISLKEYCKLHMSMIRAFSFLDLIEFLEEKDE